MIVKIKFKNVDQTTHKFKDFFWNFLSFRGPYDFFYNMGLKMIYQKEFYDALLDPAPKWALTFNINYILVCSAKVTLEKLYCVSIYSH